MKYSAIFSLAIAPLAMAKVIRNTYPVEARDGHLKKGGAQHIDLAGGNAVGVGGHTQVIIVWVNPGAGAETTPVEKAVTVTHTVTAGASETTVGTATIPAGATSVVAGPGATHSVLVGGPGGLAYTPSEIQAAVGDMVVFTFMSQNHTVTQSTFAKPCDPMEGGMNSGFQPNKDNAVDPAPQVAMQVMNTEPIWFYCAQNGHCGKGMVFSINPTAEKSQAIFQAAAIQQKGQGTGSAITGNATESAGGAAGEAAPTNVAPGGGAGEGAPAETGAAGGASGTVAAGPIQTGVGTIQDGACVCAVSCGVGSFPAVQAQGLGNSGGFPGAIPMSMAEVW